MLAQSQMGEQADVAQQLRVLIETGGHVPGDRLPAERELMSTLGVTRNALRRALDSLEREGAIWRHVGKGTFVAANVDHGAFVGLAELSHQVTPLQMMRARHALEPAIAREAAVNASAEALIKIRTARDRANSASSWDAYEADDDAFHRSIAESTGNILLLSLFDHLNNVRRAVAWRQVIRKSVKPPADHPSFREHDDIVSAIEARDPLLAFESLRDHLSSVTKRLYGDV